MWADLDQRTMATGEALLDGLFPGCGLKPQSLASAKVDPLFHPVEAGICTIDPKLAETSVLGRIGGGFDAILEAYREPLARMQSVLDCCSVKLCEASGKAACTLTDVPSKIEHGKNGVMLKGPIAIGSTVAEILLMEYSDGLPADQVAWGRASTPAALSAMFPLHTLDFDLIERSPYIAARLGSNLAKHVLAALTEENDADLVVFVGHDTNIASLGGLIGLDWALPTYQPNQTPPGGAIAFELLREEASGERFVEVAYYSQTVDQLREGTILGLDNPPARAEIAVPGCIVPGRGIACPLQRFTHIIEQAIDQECVTSGRRIE